MINICKLPTLPFFCVCLLLCARLSALAASPVVQAGTPVQSGAVAAASTEVLITTMTIIMPGCVLNIDVKDEPALSGEYVVDGRGAIHFTIADDEGKHKEQWSVSVEKKTAETAQTLIAQSLKTYLRQPDVHVTLVRIPHVHVELSGTGVKKDALDLGIDAHLSDVLAACKMNADFAHILILRLQRPAAVAKQSSVPVKISLQAPDKTSSDVSEMPARRTLAINFSAYQQGESTEDPKLEDGDKIYIQLRPKSEEKPEYILRTVRVVGEVGREVDLPLTPDMTLKDALARAGGLKETADKSRIRLHRGEGGKDYDLKAAGILADEPEMNLKLEPGDYIVVSKTDLSMRWGIDGEVVARNVFPYQPGDKITVSRAIARVGGLTKKGDPHKGVLRKGYLINPTQSRDIVFDYDAIMKKKQTDWVVEPGDVVLVLPRPHHATIWQQLLPIALHFLPLPI